MTQAKKIGKREFIQNTSLYLNGIEEGKPLIITHHHKPDLLISKIKTKTFSDLRGCAHIEVIGDVNEHVLMTGEEWFS